MGLYNFRGNFITPGTVAQNILDSGLVPTNIAQQLNASGQVIGATYTYADGSRVFGTFVYADTTAREFSSSTFTLSAVSTPPPAPTGNATGYTLTTTAVDFVLGQAATLTVAAVGGVFQSGLVITPAVSGVTGVFSPTTLTAAGTVTFTPSTTGTATISATNNQSLANPSNLVRTVIAPPLLSYTKLSPNVTIDQNNVVTLPNIDRAMAISAQFPTTSFNEVSFVVGSDLLTRGATVQLTNDDVFNAESDVFFGRPGVGIYVANGSMIAAVPKYGDTPTGRVGNVTNILAGYIVRMRKVGFDVAVEYSADSGTTYTLVGTAINALRGLDRTTALDNLYLKVVKAGTQDGSGNQAPAGSTVRVEVSLV